MGEAVSIDLHSMLCSLQASEEQALMVCQELKAGGNSSGCFRGGQRKHGKRNSSSLAISGSPWISHM